MTDYDRIAQVIRHLDAYRAEQPSLADLARAAGLSEFHFHRLFHRFAGVTPKVFLQCLTLNHAAGLLRQGHTVLDASLDAGLSGPSRLHDLCVRLEAASPGEVKSGGSNWTITAGFAVTPFGHCLIGQSPRGICHLSFVSDDNQSDTGEGLSPVRTHWPAAQIKRDDQWAKEVCAAVFNLSPTDNAAQTLRTVVRGTPFQVRVWRALLDVPPGGSTTYGQLARDIGSDRAARAVGSAVGQNPIAWLIPCHRVIRGTGAIGGYHWGPERKRIMLAWETAVGRTAAAETAS